MSSEQAYVLTDHCNTIYMSKNGHGDIGQNIAKDQPELLGSENPQEFIDQVERAYRNGHTENESDGLGYILAQNNQDLEQVISRAVEAQQPQDYADGFIYLLNTQEHNIDIVTAGIEDVAEQTLKQRTNGNTPEITGAKLQQTGQGLEVDQYCSGSNKTQLLREKYGINTIDELPTIALGNSDSNDGPMIREAQIGIGRGGAYQSADLYTEEDEDFWTRGTLVTIAAELLEPGEGKPLEAAEEFAKKADQLEPVQTGGNPNKQAEEILEIFEQVEQAQ